MELLHRRQPFLTAEYYENMVRFFDEEEAFWNAQTLDEDYAGQGESIKADEIRLATFSGLLLRYTAGEPVDRLEPHLQRLIEQCETYQRCLEYSEGVRHVSPLSIKALLAHYEECVQIMSLCILLHRTDLLARFVTLTDQAGFSGDDALYEGLLAKLLPDRVRVTRCYHPMYERLLQALDARSADEAAQHLQAYCSGWYEAFEGASTDWHDTHTEIDGDEGSYVGYWAFEAGAIAYLHNLDDSAIDHMVYPKDLVEYARAQRAT
ncbi:PoNe immunity protein domain-containing protein [Pseudomonas sp. NPDC089406]|uniref:PoNe immunity protein domain-containing protein n=1 Tax=Pseudomonas sp. NPDC089406 TaxID=3364463 RepID=UPI00384F9AC6